MIKSEVSHVGFSDESHWNEGRYHSLSLVTLPIEFFKDIELQIKNLLNESAISEFKWNKLYGARERIAAQKICKFIVDAACDNKLRVDVLTWDIEDSRHKIPKHDDIANLQRMYYHLFRNVLCVRWPDVAIWRLHPDEHTAMDWDTVQDCLDNVACHLGVEISLFSQNKFRLKLYREFRIEQIQPLCSKDHPLLQAADLFAGMAVLSRQKFNEYQNWQNNKSGRSGLFNGLNKNQKISQALQERFQVLHYFDLLCKLHKMGVSLRTKKGLWTPDPKNPINFWLYEPQHPADKAPQRA